jgi:hypothetical protein
MPVGGAGALDKSATPGTAEHPTGPTPANTMKGANAAGTATNTGANAKPKPAPTPKTTAPKGNAK